MASFGACGCRPVDEGWVPNLTFVLPDLAIGGRVPDERWAQVAERQGIGAVVDLRDEEWDDAVHLDRHGIAFLHAPTPDHGALGPDDLARGVAFARDTAARGARLLVHCEHGIGRSATLALAILVDRGMDPLLALDLAKTRRALVSPSPAQYEGWVAWLRGPARAGGATPAVPDFDGFRAIAYRHLAGF